MKLEKNSGEINKKYFQIFLYTTPRKPNLYLPLYSRRDPSIKRVLKRHKIIHPNKSTMNITFHRVWNNLIIL